MIKVGIVGCGKIADSHVEQIQRIDGATIVGVCDREKLMAAQLAERYGAGTAYDDVAALVSEAKPDVVHVTTPPQSHFDIAKFLLESGCHVYVEKPFTLTYPEAVDLVELARSKGRKITVGHDYQFTSAKRRMRTLIEAGALGGGPYHIESYHCYELGSDSYARALLGDKKHWVRELPGKLMHNNISHGISAIAEFMDSRDLRSVAVGYRSKFLEDAGENEIIDEARVVVTDGASNSAYFTFSSQMRPLLHRFAIYGRGGGIVVDQDQQSCVTIRGSRYKSYIEKFVPSLTLARQYAGNSLRNMGLFMKNDFHMKSGMKHLIESFYRSIVSNAPEPISMDEILRTALIMDQIFDQLHGPRVSAGGG